ncbi:MAG TPA: hypothetical protein VIT68_01745 [Candidatus Gracilibacteria bacterium]
MKINNPFAAKQFNAGHILLTVWFVVATVFAFFHLKGLLYGNLYRGGYQKAVNELIDTANNSCDPLKVSNNGRVVELVNLECLKPKAGDTLQDVSLPKANEAVELQAPAE